MTIKLKEHQQQVVSYMKKSNIRGIILYHGLGSGKTITSIAITETYSNNGIVIVPASMRVQWNSELIKMKVDLTKYNVMSYQGFLKLLEVNKSLSLKNKNIIVDEAHRIRNTTGVIAQKLVKSLQSANKVILLTGTPMVNAPVDMSSLINSTKELDVLPVTERSFRDKFFILQSRPPPPIDKRCIEYSGITCSNGGVRQKTKFCAYHNYGSLKRSSKKIRDLNNFKRNKEYEIKEKERIAIARAKANHFKLIPNTSEYAKYVKGVVSFYKPSLTTGDFPDVNKKIMKVKMSDIQDKMYKKALKKISKTDTGLLENGNEVVRKTTSFNAFLNTTRQISNTYDGQRCLILKKIRQLKIIILVKLMCYC
jgi:SNF2 family DNA or RNA helicase